jgi:hypothetical protein
MRARGFSLPVERAYRRGFPRRFGRIVTTAFTAAVFATYLIALPTHLVHHLFDEDGDRPNCPLFASSQHTPEIQVDPLSLTPPALIEIARVGAPEAFRPFGRPAAAQSRAPPHSAPSA